METVVAESRFLGLNGAVGSAIGSSIPGDLIISLAQASQAINAWGNYPRQRDLQLRQFWPTENWLASTIYSTTARYAAFDWTLSGPPRTASLYQDMLHNSEHGEGWQSLIAKLCIDLFTQDNGAFLEVVRADNSPTSPVIQLNHLDSIRCLRTGRRDAPVIYTDINGKDHLLQDYHVLPLTEFPSPVESMRGYQYSAISRILAFAQIMRDVTTFKGEKISGRFNRAVHLIGGVQGRTLETALRQKQAEADGRGLTRYIEPVIIAALDPTARVSHEEIMLAALPDGFDEEVAMKWYITNLAMAFGTDYQDYAPMPGGGLGSGNQAKVQHSKSKTKGPALFMNMLQHLFNFHGIMPRSVRFKMGEMDVGADMDKTALRKERALEREILIRSGQITTEVARQMAVDEGDLDPRYLVMMREVNATEEQVVVGSEPPPPDDPVKPGKPGPDEPPKAGGPVSTASPNSNDSTRKPPGRSQRNFAG